MAVTSSGRHAAVILVNGEMTSQLAVTDRGLAYGDGLFETMAAVGGTVRHWPRHLARLREGCVRLGLPPPEAGVLEREIETARGTETRAIIKLILTRGSGARGYRPPADPRPTRIVSRLPWPALDAAPMRLGMCRTRLGRNPTLAGVKHLNRLEQVLGAAELDGLGVEEALMQDDLGQVIAGTRTNVFAIRGEAVITPDLGQCGIAGIMRGLVLEHAGACGLEVHVAPLTLTDLDTADGIFLTNAIVGLWPVAALAVAGRERRFPPTAAFARLRRHFAATRLA